MQRLPKIGLPALALGFILLIFVSKSSINIGYGEAGVLFKTFGGGVVTDTAPLGEGFHIIAPWNKVYVYNVKQQEFFEGNMQVLSSNGLEISLDVSVLYQPKYDELGLLHKTKGENYVNVVLIPQIRAVARSVVGRYTPEQLYSTKRDAIQNEIYDETKKNVESQHIQLNAVLVRDVTYPSPSKKRLSANCAKSKKLWSMNSVLKRLNRKQNVNVSMLKGKLPLTAF